MSGAMKPIVSVFINAYNRKNYIMGALRSVLSQDISKGSFELKVVKNFLDNDIDSFCKENGIESYQVEGSIGDYINTAIDHSNGDIIAFLDDDDMFAKAKLSRIIQCYSDLPGLDYYHNRIELVEEGGDYSKRKYSETFLHQDIKSTRICYVNISTPKQVKEAISFGGAFNMSSIAISKKLGRLIQPLLSELYYAQDEFMFYMAWTFANTLVFDTEPLTLYRDLSYERHASGDLTGLIAFHAAHARMEVESLSRFRSLVRDELKPIIEGDLSIRALRSYVLGDCHDRLLGMKLLLRSLNPRTLILDKYTLSIRLLGILSLLSPDRSRRLMFHLKRRTRKA